MELFKNIAGAMLGAKDFVVEKNRKAALINRLRSVISCEEQGAERAYLALGRYYYHNLRDVSNSITEPHCADIDSSDKRLEQAIAHLEKIYSEGEDDSVIEKIDLEDAREITPDEDPLVEDTAVEGIVDEAVEAVSEPVGESQELPFEG